MGGEGNFCGGSANPVPVVAENFLYLTAQNHSASPVEEVAPLVRVCGGGEFTVDGERNFSPQTVNP